MNVPVFESEQQRLISRVHELCRLDSRLDAALMYGSFAQGTGDAHSDVEFWLFFDTDLRHVDASAWCNQVAPVLHVVRNEFGAHVAFFAGLIRGEFHFATVDDIAAVARWPARGAPVHRMIVVDRHNRLRPALESLPDSAPVPQTWADIDALCGRFANGWYSHTTFAGGANCSAHSTPSLMSTATCCGWPASSRTTPSTGSRRRVGPKPS